MEKTITVAIPVTGLEDILYMRGKRWSDGTLAMEVHPSNVDEEGILKEKITEAINKLKSFGIEEVKKVTIYGSVDFEKGTCNSVRILITTFIDKNKNIDNSLDKLLKEKDIKVSYCERNENYVLNINKTKEKTTVKLMLSLNRFSYEFVKSIASEVLETPKEQVKIEKEGIFSRIKRFFTGAPFNYNFSYEDPRNRKYLNIEVKESISTLTKSKYFITIEFSYSSIKKVRKIINCLVNFR